MNREDLLWDLVESEAKVLYFLDRKDFTPKGSAIIITSSPVGHFPKKKSDKYTLWFGHGIERKLFKTLKKAEEYADKILEGLSKDITPRIVRQ